MSVVTVVASNLRRGMAIKYKGDSGILLEVEHRSPGKGAGFVQVIMRSFASGKSKDLRFAASEKAEIIQTDRQKLEFSYSDPSGIYFMDTTTYETVELPKGLLSDYDGMLIENLVCEVLFVEGKPVSVELPPSIELLVTEAPEGLKGDTANNPTKAAKMETGLEVQVPLFVKWPATAPLQRRKLRGPRRRLLPRSVQRPRNVILRRRTRPAPLDAKHRLPIGGSSHARRAFSF
jgi:elongation factor P